MAKIVFNACFGGFSLSEKALARARELTSDPKWGGYDARDIARHNPILVQVVEELATEADGNCAALEIREISSGTKYRISEYDGNECVITFDEEEWIIAP